MGYCCSQSAGGDENNLSTALYPQGASLGGRHFTAKDIFIIVKIQSCFRMYMAKRRVSMIKQDMYSPGMGHMHEQGEDFENINVQVSDATKVQSEDWKQL